MKAFPIKYFLLLLLLQSTIITQGQIADFPFNTDLDDIVEGYSPTASGSPTIIDDSGNQAIQLQGDEYLSLPNALHQSIDIDQDIEIQIRFKITDTYADAPYAGTGEFGQEGKRILLSNKENAIFDRGFDIFVSEMDEEYRILMSFGDDTEQGGTFIFNDLIQEDTWTELKLIFRLNNSNPSIVYKLNGYYHHFPLNYLDVDMFKESLNTQQLWLGTDTNNTQEDEDYAFAETSIDYLKIFNPIFVGNSTSVASALDMMSNHVNGNATLSDAQQQVQLRTIVDNWDDNTYAAISSAILDYMSIYEEEEGAVFEFYTEYIDPKEVEAPRSLQFMLIQYMIDNLYTDSNVAEMEGISFLDHEIMPGEVSDAAPRITGTVNIDGDYNTDPGFFLNTQGFVIRPTGYYAAPGEIVNINFPSAILNQGAKVHVGAHFVDIREDYRGFQRFPTLATRFEINSSTMSVANPLGGAIYVTFPDGSNFGSVAVQIDNAVKSPYYSSKTGFSNSLAQYQTDLSNAYVNWVDIESDNFMCTFPKALANMSPDASAMLTPFNEMIAQFNVLSGRPTTKIRSEYIISEPQTYTQGTYPASYPMSLPNGDLDEADPQAFPVSVLDPQIYMNTYDGTTVLHELGHLHSFPTMFEEGETNVNIPIVIAFNTVFDVPLDTALYYSSGFQYLDGDQAALDWILDPKFRNNEETDYLDVSYQLRGLAKYVDVARLFSWDSLGVLHNHWYETTLDSGEPSGGIDFISPDEYIEVASDQLDFNFAPLWELWGSIPSQALFNQLASYTKENRIKERILHYKALVPSNAAEYQTVYNSITPNIEDHHKVRYDNMLTYYDESVADSIYTRINDILCRYFETACGTTAVDVLEENVITISPNPTKGIFEITGLQSGYTIKVLSSNGLSLKAMKSTGLSQSIDMSDLPAGLYFIDVLDSQNANVLYEKIIKH